MKNKWIAGLAGLLALAAVGVTLAYFTSERSATNTITIGTNTIAVEEDFTPPSELQAGLNRYQKKVTIRNTGTTDAYIRVYAEFSDSDIAACSFIAATPPTSVSGIASGMELTDVTREMSAAGYSSHDVFWSDSCPAEDWVYISASETGDDALLGGYFYYTKAVSPGYSTAALMDTVATYFADASDIKDYDIIVYAESVQTADKDGKTFTGDDAYKQAWKEFLSRK